MAHQQQQNFFKDICARFPDKFKNASKILEIGSQNINGSVRDFFPDAREYLGIDLGLANDVDWTIPGELIELPDGWADVVISTECFEHCRDWEKVFINMIRIGKPGSLLLVTCAGIGRAAHGTIDSNESDSPFTTSYYKNLGADDFTSRIATGWYFSSHGFEVNSQCHDLYFWGLRSSEKIQECDHYWEDAMSRLARAQGQLGQAVARHSAILHELNGAKAVAEQARAEIDELQNKIIELNLSHDIAEQARAEIDELQNKIIELNLSHDIIEENFHRVIRSTSWRVTLMPRRMMDQMRALLRSMQAQSIHHFDESFNQRQVPRSSPYGQQIKNSLKKPLPITKRLLRWGYLNMPLPIAAKRRIWTRLMLIKGCIGRTSNVDISGIGDVPSLSKKEQIEAIASLRFPEAVIEPEISIIIPCYNQIHYTISCLSSILDHPPSVSYEVIVVDDASNSDDYRILDGVDGLHVIHNRTNVGYLKSCNNGIRIALGRYICLLNNDVKVLHSSFDSLYKTFTYFPTAGLVGSKLLYPTGQLQEAGGIVWNDGSAWNVGRLCDPDEPQYNYLRSVDYCSAASIMVPRHILNKLDGFDEKYRPAYYEDTDLAFRIRRLGFEVLYQPGSVIVHYEGISHGRDLNQGLKKHQLVNAETFQATWQSQLTSHRPNGEDPDQEKDRGFGLRVLLVDKCTPSPDRDAGSVVLLNLMLLLRHLGYQPTFIPDNNYANLHPYTHLCQSLGIECLYAPYVTSLKQHLKQFGRRYDLVILFRPDLSHAHFSLARKMCPKAKIIYYPHDLHYIRMQRESALLNKQSLKARAMESKKIELDLSLKADSTIVVSMAEQKELATQIPTAKVNYLPLIVNEPSTGGRAQHGGNDLVFVGNFNHVPNEDAVCWFASNVLALITKIRPNAIFHVVGANPPGSVCKLAGPNVVIHGFVEDLDAFFSTMTVSVAPLRFGAGMKGKIVSSMRAGLPVVCTSIGSEGMQLDHQIHAWIADDAPAFAHGVLQILETKDLWERLSQSGIDLCAERWGKNASIKGLQQILTELGLTCVSRDRPESLMIYPFK